MSYYLSSDLPMKYRASAKEITLNLLRKSKFIRYSLLCAAVIFSWYIWAGTPMTGEIRKLRQSGYGKTAFVTLITGQTNSSFDIESVVTLGESIKKEV